MIPALYIAASGMNAQQIKIDNVANNLANVSTTGFKKSRSTFEDLMYHQVRAPGASSSSETTVPTGVQIGHGVKTAAVDKIFSQGDLQQTGNMLDLSIEGDGFFQVLRPTGEVAYTRAGSFRLDRDGRVVNVDGMSLQPEITIPPDTVSMTIGEDGTVTVLQAGQTNATQVGQIELVNFINPSGLLAVGQNLFLPTDASGDPVTGTAGENGLGRVLQGFLENSNVDVAEELINMIMAQRAYEVNSRAIQAADDMLQTVSQMV